MDHGWLRFSLLALAPCLLSACGDDRPPPVPTDSGIRYDARPPVDGAVDAGPAMDSSTDGPTPLDAGMPDSGDFPVCRTDPDDAFTLGVDIVARERVVAVAGAADGFLVAWSEARVGVPDVFVRPIPSTGVPPDEARLTGGTALSQGPTLLSLGTSFLAAWFDNALGNFEIRAQAVSSAGVATGTTQRLTDNALRDDNPALLRMGSNVLAVWVEDDLLASTRIARSRILSASGMPTGAPQAVTVPPESPTLPMLAPLGDGAAMVWAENRLDTSHIVLRRLDASGAAVGSGITLDTEANADGTADIATTTTGGAVVFGALVGGVRHEVRLRRVDDMGMPIGAERIITLPPQAATGPSIVRFGGGYAVAYRVLADTGLTEPIVRAIFIDSVGDLVDSFDLGTATAAGGRVTIRASADGSLLVAWADVAGGTTEMKAVRIRCGL